MAIDKTRCQIGEHCHGTGVIEAHVVEWDLLVYVKCAAGSEHNILVDRVREDLLPESGNYSRIHPADSTDHVCDK